MLKNMLKNQNLNNAPRSRRIDNLFRIFAVVAFALALHVAASAQTGIIEICQQAAGAGLENKIFQFQVSGYSQTIQVPVGQCSGPIQVPVGVVTISEASFGFFTNRAGTFSGGFQLLDVSLLQYDQSQPNPLKDKNLYARQATLEVRAGGFQNETLVLFTNAYAAEAFIEICNRADDAPNTTANAAGYAFNGFQPNHQLQLPPGACGLFKVYLPSTPGAPYPATGTVRITQYNKPAFTLESVSTNPSERFNSLTFGTGIIDHRNSDCLYAPDPSTIAGCTFNNPQVSFVDVDVVQGNAPTTATKVTFNNRFAATRNLKICKIAGPGVAIGTPFTFDITLDGGAIDEIIAPVTVTAGDVAAGGNCVVSRGLDALGSFPVNSIVNVVERAAAETFVSAIISPTSVLSNVNLTQRKASLAIGESINTLTFINAASTPISAPVSAGNNVSAAPISDLNLTFGSVSTAGTTTITALPPEQEQPLPFGFSISGSGLIYEITTSAVFSGNITVSFDVPNVLDAATCSQLVILHYTNNAWDTSGNAAPVYNSSSRTCTVSQVVTSLSPFAVGKRLDSDNDGVADVTDAFPFDPNEFIDTDSDGVGNNADTDDDNDGQSDESEIACGSNPVDATSKCPPSVVAPPTNINECKNGGWKIFATPRRFKNQGDCIQFVNTGK